jgi:hypothetical protein
VTGRSRLTAESKMAPEGALPSLISKSI